MTTLSQGNLMNLFNFVGFLWNNVNNEKENKLEYLNKFDWSNFCFHYIFGEKLHEIGNRDKNIHFKVCLILFWNNQRCLNLGGEGGVVEFRAWRNYKTCYFNAYILHGLLCDINNKSFTFPVIGKRVWHSGSGQFISKFREGAILHKQLRLPADYSYISILSA